MRTLLISRLKWKTKTMFIRTNRLAGSPTDPKLTRLEETGYQPVQRQLAQAIAGVAPKAVNELVIEVAQALANKAGVKSPQIVRAYDGVVTLRGEVENDEVLARAEEVVLAVGGVLGVINGFTVKLQKASQVDEWLNPFGFQPSNSFQSSSQYLPRGEMALVENAVIYATDGRVGLVKGLVFLRPEGKVQYLIVANRKTLLKSWRRLPFEYVEGGYDNPYTYPDPDIFLKVTRADFERLSEKLELPEKGGQARALEQSIIFGEKTVIRDQAKMLGWLAGVLLDRTGYSHTLNPSLSHYLLKTPAYPKTHPLPFEMLEMSPKEQALDFKLGVAQTLTDPYQFNGFGSPAHVIEKVLERLAVSGIMQLRGSCLRVSYDRGEVTLKGVLAGNYPIRNLMELVEAVSGVRRVNNQVEAIL